MLFSSGLFKIARQKLLVTRETQATTGRRKRGRYFTVICCSKFLSPPSSRLVSATKTQRDGLRVEEQSASIRLLHVQATPRIFSLPQSRNPYPINPPRTSSHHQIQNHPPPSSTSSGLGIRVSIKPQHRITPPPQLSPHMGEIPRSTFQFDFDFERRVLAEAEKDKQNWSRLGQENLPSRPSESSSVSSSSSMVCEFVTGYNLLREMGFSSKAVAEALAMYDNDTDKALAHFLNNPS